MKPKNLDHVVFIVRDLESAERAWKDVFGLVPGQRVGSDLLQADLALLPSADPSSAFIELCNPTASGPLTEWLDRQGEGMLSLSIEVEDVAAAVDELRAQGIEVSDVVPGPLPNTEVARFAPQATHGVRLQLLERLA
jgi:catechol 2,3-dioxygenase-like lactoylglutathione lyase family enzyme